MAGNGFEGAVEGGLEKGVDERFGPAHPVTLSGTLRSWLGRDEIIVNSLHWQGIQRLAPSLTAEAHAEEDRKNREAVEERNRADQAVYAAERMLADAGDKLSAADKAPVEAAIADLKKALEANDVDGMKRGMQALTSAQHKVAEVLYRATATPPGGGAAGGPGTGSTSTGQAQGDVIDAEVVEDEKK